jgi:hypothetical protein
MVRSKMRARLAMNREDDTQTGLEMVCEDMLAESS